jgi:hypothetical protein
MKKFISATALTAISVPALISTAAASGPVLTLENYVGKITVITQPGVDLAVTEKDRASDVSINTGSNQLTIDGGIDQPNGKDCKGYYGKVNWSWNSKSSKSGDFGGYKNLDDYPKMTITGPEDMTFVVKNSIPFGTIGNLEYADVSLKHCGRLEIGDVTERADISIRGSGDIEIGNVGILDVNLVGSGDVTANQAKAANISLIGSGDVIAKDIDVATVTLKGSGDVELGNINQILSVDSSGSGDVTAGNVAGMLNYTGKGSGDLNIDSMNGEASLRVMGSGDVDIDDGTITNLEVKASGASNVDFGGTAQDAQLRASGASDIYVESVTELTYRKASGAADIEIGD